MIKRVTDTSLIVTVLSESACSGCHAKGVCSIAGQKEKDIDVKVNGTCYKQGQYVNVILKESHGIKALVFGYLIPFFLVLLVLIIAFAITSNEVTSACLSLGILIPYYAGLLLFKNSFDKIFRFEIEKIE